MTHPPASRRWLRRAHAYAGRIRGISGVPVTDLELLRRFAAPDRRGAFKYFQLFNPLAGGIVIGFAALNAGRFLVCSPGSTRMRSHWQIWRKSETQSLRPKETG